MIVELPDTTTSQVSKTLVKIREEGGVVALGRVLTLVIATAPGGEEEAIEAANDASREHPMRVIVVASDPEEPADTPARLDAEIRVGGDAGASEVIVLRASLEEAVGDRPLAGLWAAEALRIAAWRPRFGAETDHRTIVHEVDWLRTAVHLHKGCYRGQETVARVHNLGRPPRRLVFLHVDGSGHALPSAGAEVRAGERVVGHVTSIARHHTDGPIALAVVKRNTDPDLVLAVEGVSAAQTVIVSP